MNRPKLAKRISFLILFLGFTVNTFGVENVFPNNSSKLSKFKEIKQSLEKQTTEEIFETWEKACEKKDTTLKNIALLELLKRWKTKTPSFKDLADKIKNKSKSSEVRDYLIYYSTFSSARKYIKPEEKKELIKSLKSIIIDPTESPSLRARAAVGLSQLDKSDEAVELVAPLLNVREEKEVLAWRAAHALKFMKNKNAIPPLRKKLKELMISPDILPKLTRSCAVALGSYKDTSSINIMDEILEKTKREDVAGSVIYSLGKIGTPESLEIVINYWNNLKKYFKDRNERARLDLTCYGALSSNEDTIIELIQENSSFSHSGVIALRKLIKFGNGYLKDNERGAEVLGKQYLEIKDIEEKGIILDALASLRGEKAIEVLQNLYNSENNPKLAQRIYEILKIKTLIHK